MLGRGFRSVDGVFLIVHSNECSVSAGSAFENRNNDRREYNRPVRGTCLGNILRVFLSRSESMLEDSEENERSTSLDRVQSIFDDQSDRDEDRIRNSLSSFHQRPIHPTDESKVRNQTFHRGFDIPRHESIRRQRFLSNCR